MNMKRFERQIMLQEIGVEGQAALANASVLIVGAGGLGSPAALYLAAAGIGRIGIADGDCVAVSNLQRQVLFTEGEVSKNKAMCAAERLALLSSETVITPYGFMLNGENMADIASEYDIIVDGCDNADTRYLINEVSKRLGKPYVYGAIAGFEGQASLFNYCGGKGYDDLYPYRGNGNAPTASPVGVIGALPGIIGSIEAMEVIKVVTGAGETLRNRLLTVNALTMKFNTFSLD